MEFRCKQFSLNHSNSSMKVGTDAVLLASVAAEFFKEINILPLPENKLSNDVNGVFDGLGGIDELSDRQRDNIKILDIGTGCGILSLCMAQVFDNSDVTAIDIDKESVKEAESNFLNRPYCKRMTAKCISVQQFAAETKGRFDLIISNPPFFTLSLHSPDVRRSNARHNDSLGLTDFAYCCSKLLNPNGYIAVVLPEKEMAELTLLFDSQSIYPVLVTDVFAKPNTPVKRQICIFAYSRQHAAKKQYQTLYIRDADNEYSRDYKQLTSLFLL